MKRIIFPLLFVLAMICATNCFTQTLITQTGTTSFPITIASPGSYKLNSNIVVPDYGIDAFNITSANVTLDLNGYSIVGPLSCSASSCTGLLTSIGVNFESFRGIVKNGNIVGFAECISMLNGGLAEYLNISSCDYGIEAQNAVIDHDTVTDCMSTAIWANSSVVSENTLVQNGEYAAATYATSVLNNSITYTTGYGLYIELGYLAGNTMYDNGTDLTLVYDAITTKNNACTSGAC